MTDWGKPKHCSECGTAIQQTGKGRPRATCRAECAYARELRLKALQRHAKSKNLSRSEKAYLEEFRREMIAPLQKRDGP